ncbi:hypothetical protein Dimus_005097 [Dionaea muscipula]
MDPSSIEVPRPDAPEDLHHRLRPSPNGIRSAPQSPTFSHLTATNLKAVSGATENLDSSHPDPVHGSPAAAVSVSDSVDLHDRENKVNFVIDLFQQRVEQFHPMETDEFVSELFYETNSFGVIEHGCSVSFADDLESELGLELGLDLEENDADCGGDFLFSDSGDSGNLAGETRFLSGLRVVGFETDSEDDEPDLLGIDLRSEDDGPDLLGIDLRSEDGGYADENVNDEELRWDSLHLEVDQGDDDKEFEWEEVDSGIDEREVFSVVADPQEEESVSGLDISVPEEERGIEEGDNLEWEELLHDYLERDSEMNSSFETYFPFQDDINYDAMYDLVFGRFGVNENSLVVATPAASKFVIDNLHSVVMTEEHMPSDALCAVCKDEMLVGVMVKQLPCSHQYHGDCILPWLEIRNTCPVCRYELPTDDAEYERRRTQTTTHAL